MMSKSKIALWISDRKPSEQEEKSLIQEHGVSEIHWAVASKCYNKSVSSLERFGDVLVVDIECPTIIKKLCKSEKEVLVPRYHLRSQEKYLAGFGRVKDRYKITRTVIEYVSNKGRQKKIIKGDVRWRDLSKYIEGIILNVTQLSDETPLVGEGVEEVVWYLRNKNADRDSKFPKLGIEYSYSYR